MRGIRWAQREIGAQPLAGLQLLRLDQRAAVAAAPAREPGERAFGFVDGDAGAAEFGDDLACGQAPDGGRGNRRSPARPGGGRAAGAAGALASALCRS